MNYKFFLKLIKLLPNILPVGVVGTKSPYPITKLKMKELNLKFKIIFIYIKLLPTVVRVTITYQNVSGIDVNILSLELSSFSPKKIKLE